MTTNEAGNPLWKQRFRTPNISFEKIAAANPNRGLVTSNLSGVNQLHAWNVETGTLQQITHESTGKSLGAISPDGKYIYYLKDEMGNEWGHIVRVPFEGGEPEDITPNSPLYATSMLAISSVEPKIVFIKITQNGFEVCLIDMDESQRIIGERTIYHSRDMLDNPIISNSGRFLAFQSTERSGKLQFNLLVLDTFADKVIYNLWDQQDCSMQVCAFSPGETDLKLLASTNHSGKTRPLILDVETGNRSDLEFPDIEGDLEPICWSPTGERVLLCQINKAEQNLFTYSPKDKTLIQLDHPGGSFQMHISDPHFVTEDEIYSAWEDSATPSQVISLDSWTGQLNQVVLNVGEALPCKPWKSVAYPSLDHTNIQAWMLTPEGEGPFPTIIHIHGGPTWALLEEYTPVSQAWVDHGFAFISINYRGSTTFGREFQDKIIGNLGHWEVKDIEAAYHWLVAQGIADPEKFFITGWSYGGYLTLLSLGQLPDLWAGGMAGIAIADWNLIYEDQAQILRGYQVALFGGTPEEKPVQYQNSSPTTYVKDVRAPMLIIQGRNDPRCPARQMEAYLEKLEQHKKEFSITWFNAGHGANAVDLQIEHQEEMMNFASAILTKQKEKGA